MTKATPLTFSTINFNEEKEQARAYITEAVHKGESVVPYVVVYKYLNPAAVLYFPPNTQEYSRSEHILDAAIFVAASKSDMSKLTIEASVPASELGLKEETPDGMVDTLLMVYCADIGTAIAAVPYRINDDGTIHWYDFEPVSRTDSGIFDSLTDLNSFTLLQFALPSQIVPFKAAIGLLLENGFKISYLDPFTEDNFSFNHVIPV